MLRGIARILLVEGEKQVKLAALLQGVSDGLRGRLGLRYGGTRGTEKEHALQPSPLLDVSVLLP
jgi:hypothetical protein